MKFEVIRSLTEFENLKAEWQELFAGSEQRRNVFTSYEWHHAVLSASRPILANGSGQLAIVVGRRRGNAEVILPLVLRKQFGIKVLSWIGDPVSQYGDVIAKPGSSQAYLIDSALKFIADETSADAFILERVREDSSLADTLKLNDHVVLRTRTAPYIDFEQFSSADDYMASHSRNRRKQHRRLWRRLEEQGPLKFEILEPGPEAALRTNQALELKTKALAAQGTYSRAFANPAFKPFFQDLASGKYAGTGFQVSCLLSNDTLVAAEIGFRSFDAYISHIGVYDAAFKKYAPGRLQIEQTIQSCFKEGSVRYDFLAPEDEYKWAWSTASVAVFDFAIPVTAAGRLYCSLSRMSAPAASIAKKILPAQLMRFAARQK